MLSRLNQKINNLLLEGRIAGASVAVTSKEGVIYSSDFGYIDYGRRIATPEGAFYRAASITKVVTGILAMTYVEEGALSLDTPIREYLPWFTLSDTSASDIITLRHLLSHTAGLPAEYTPEGPRDESALLTVLLESLPTLPLVSHPSEGKFLYSNWGFRIVSAVIEAVAGDKYSALASRRVLEPLSMRESFFFLPDAYRERRSMPHTATCDGFLTSDYIMENYSRLAVGGLYSTARDLTALVRLILNEGVTDSGERIIMGDTLRLMMEPLTFTPNGNGYGLAMQSHTTDGGNLSFGHYGSAPPYTSAMFAAPSLGLGVVVALNTDHPTLRRNIADLALDSFAGAV